MQKFSPKNVWFIKIVWALISARIEQDLIKLNVKQTTTRLSCNISSVTRYFQVQLSQFIYCKVIR